MTTPYRIALLSGASLVAATTPAFPAPVQQPAPAEAIKEGMLPVVEFILAKCTEFGWGLIALGFLAILLIGFFAAWGVSRLLTPETGTLPNALRYYILGMAATVIILGFTSVIFWYGITSGSFGLAIGVIILAILAGLIINFIIPMKVYDIGFLRAFCFNLLVGLATGISQGVLGALVPGPFDTLSGKSTEEQQKAINEWHLKKGENQLNAKFDRQSLQSPADTAALTPGKRMQQMHDQLQAERAKLDVNNQPSVIAFNKRVAEYNAFKAQYAATLATPPARSSTPAPKTRPKQTKKTKQKENR